MALPVAFAVAAILGLGGCGLASSSPDPIPERNTRKKEDADNNPADAGATQDIFIPKTDARIADILDAVPS